ncbi:MAG TPA: outer membrane protein assembly factor BamA [Blastocatellia bacterium]|nr:outer membrane protein assembly factor BamA [Blastocatellia bacterium]
MEDIEIRGNRRIPRESILYYVQSKPQDRYDLSLAQRDLQAILQMGLFDPLATKLYVEDGPRGGKIVIFQVKEYPIIRDLQYRGMKSATESEVLTRFKERRVQVSKESQFDPAKANGARVVIRELLAEKGHPDAAVAVEVEEISATTVALIFNVEEGPRVRVKEIEFVGDHNGFSQGRLRGAMKLVKEAGMFSAFSSKDIYFKDKLMEDLERVRFYLGTRGYLQAKIGEPQVDPAGKFSAGMPLPLLRKSGPGLKVGIPIEVGRRYKISKVEEKGVTIFQPGIIKAVSGLRDGEWVDSKKIQENVYKGVKDLYGTQGYIQADVNFIPKFIDKTPTEGEVEVTLEVEEGRQFTLRRLEFIGNASTRDVVLRREVLLNEGDPYNKRYWDLSILHLNQLGLFEEVKEKDAITRTNDRDQTVDIDLQVKEKGKQQIQLNGGVSGFAGSFFGLEYSTNNFLGYGESLSVAFSGGNRQLYAMFGFTEPYFMGKPISLGFQIYGQRAQFVGQGFNFGTTVDQLQQASLFGLSSIDADTLFTQKTIGGSVSLQGQLGLFTKKFPNVSRFTRLGLTYSLASNRVQDPARNRDADPSNDIPITYTQPPILTSRLIPNIYYNTKNAYLDPTRGQSLYLGFGLAGGVIGGDVNSISPSMEYQLFVPALRKRSDKPHVVAMRFRADHIRTFGKPLDTKSLSFVGGIPIYERFFLGGENDIRGYNFRSISPVVPYTSYLSSRNARSQVVNADGTLSDAPGAINALSLANFNRTAPDPSLGCTATSTNGPGNCNVLPSGNLFTPVGGDTQFIWNMEYRIPVVSVLSLAAFADVGTSFNARKYRDQVVSGNFVTSDLSGYALLFPGTRASVNQNGVLLTNPDRTVANLNSFPPGTEIDPLTGDPTNTTRARVTGEAQSYSIVGTSMRNVKFLNDLRSSMGLEFRVQMPVINVPFRLIFAYNPQARTDTSDPTVLFIERKTVVRFSVGRTF